MKFRYLENFAVPFQTKRAICLSWMLIFVICLAVPGLANDDVQQIDLKETKQLFKQAEKLTRKGKFPEAEKLLREILSLDSTNSKAKLSLSNVLNKQIKINQAYQYCFDVAKNEPKNAKAFALVGMVALNLGNFKEARMLFYRAGQINGNEPMAWAGFGMLDFYENRIDDAIKELETAEYHEPNEPDYIFALAQVLARAEKYKEAAEAYNRFLSISPPTDTDRRDRIKGLINFLRYLGNKQELYRISRDTKQTIVPLKMMRDRPIIELKINGKDEKLRFVLDTGSGISVISQDTAERLKIKSISKGGLARAIGGNGKFEIVYGFLKNVDIGDVRVSNVPVYIRKFHDDIEKIDGYIGLSLISKFLTTVDYGNLTFTLTKKNEQTTQNFEKEAIALPLRLTSSGFLSGEVQLHGIEAPLNFIVDTGASISVISSVLASTSEMSQFSSTEKMRVIGAAGITENVSSYLLPKVSFGEHSRESVKAIALDLELINEASGFEQAGILGGNFLKNYRLTFDFQNSKVTFIPVKKK